MNTTRLKSFAAEARNTLRRGVMNRLLALGFDKQGKVVQQPTKMEGGAVFMGETVSEDFYNKWSALRERIAFHGLREVLEEAAYTWFNRLMAIRIMQMNGLIDPVLDYRSDSVRLPILLTNAQAGNIPTMPAADRDRLRELLNNPTRTAEQFAILITAFCHNTPVINACFGRLADYTELLLPNDILEENGFLDRMNHTDFIDDEDYKSPELIGWLYQFYISERKDEVFAKKGKYDPDEIPAATQIFTPNWIVKYMVQNTVGRIYLDNNPYEDELKSKWKYLVENDQQGEKLGISDLADMKVADLACGSGHILNECFDLLLDLYVNEGYNRRQAVESIFANNLTGIDIDTRAKQLATFALLLKACQNDKSFADAHAMPRVLDMPEPFMSTAIKLGKITAELTDAEAVLKQVQANIDHAIQEYFVTINTERLLEVRNALLVFTNCNSLGSIMKFDISENTRYAIEKMTSEWRDKQRRGDALPANVKRLLPYFTVMLVLTQKYSALVMNPPYMGSGSMGEHLLKYVKDYYEDGKADLFSTFMILAINRLEDKGKYGMINMHNWMFLSSFERLRHSILKEQSIDSLLHLGARTFDELSGEVVQNAAYVITKVKPGQNTGTYFRLVDGRDCGDKEHKFLVAIANHITGIFYSNVAQANFEKIPSSPLAYWLSDTFIEVFNSPKLNDVASAKQGTSTGDNDKFLRLWTEVDFTHFNIDVSKNHDFTKKWYPATKGGSFRKWFGNNDFIVNWQNDGQDISNCRGSAIRNREANFKEALTWTGIGNNLGMRYCPTGFVFLISGKSIIGQKDNLKYILGCCCSKVATQILKATTPSLSFEVGYIANIPIKKKNEEIVNEIVTASIAISREDWDAHETSWDFKENELIRLSKEGLGSFGRVDNGKLIHDGTAIIGLVLEYKVYWDEKFKQLHANEEELNRQFIEIYGLQNELKPDVPFDEVTILQDGEISIENNQIVWHEDVLMKQLISYAVGCWMGRYRLDQPGLYIAHTGATREEIAPYEYNDEPFEIDDDGIIPLMPRDCMFPDNAALRLADFVRQVFGSMTQIENLNFIEEALGMTVEQYFIKQFWKDHKKMYQNRPIYWLFSSKKGAFQCIAYMHRMDAYTVERVRQKYLLPHMEDLRRRIAELAERAASLNTQERKTLESLGKQLEECMEYHDRLHPVADRQIAFDLDDGVVVNYAKFGDILAKIK